MNTRTDREQCTNCQSSTQMKMYKIMSVFFSTSDWMLEEKLKSMHLTIYHYRHVLNTSFKHFMYWTSFSPEAQCCCSWRMVEWNECSQGSEPERLDVSTHKISWNAPWRTWKLCLRFQCLCALTSRQAASTKYLPACPQQGLKLLGQKSPLSSSE